jgi:hypothetical protein
MSSYCGVLIAVMPPTFLDVVNNLTLNYNEMRGTSIETFGFYTPNNTNLIFSILPGPGSDKFAISQFETNRGMYSCIQ